ncbi:LOW QUALITY PROTEIN: aquaporin-10 [Megaptera novaeangliae]
MVINLLIQGTLAQAVTSGGTKGHFFTMFLAGSLGVRLAIYVSGNVSGAHLNPAFSLAMCLLGCLPWAKFPIYSLVQLLSAFCASGAVYALYHDALQNYTGGNLTVIGPKETASIFVTYPVPYLSLSNGFLDQMTWGGSLERLGEIGQMEHLTADGSPSASVHSNVLGTWMLIVGILAILDTRNKGVPAGVEPVVVGLLILAIRLSMGASCGFPINPAWDLDPRLFTYVAGWGPEVFRGEKRWQWLVVGPLVRATLSTATHQRLMPLHHPEHSEPAQDLECAQPEASDLESPAATQAGFRTLDFQERSSSK